MAIDINFDFRTDATGKNPDPDASSPTLLRYHHLLWSKPQKEKPAVATAMKLFESGALVAEPEYTTYEVASAESPA